ncbi:MAG: tRNA pseudouridine(38-40) synthase TruA [Cyclonatronaceae bacterium]
MARYAIRVAYKGTAYAGWQIQPNEHTIQGELWQVLKTVLRQEVNPTGAGRTDAGVHATGQVAHFDFNGEIDPKSLLRSMYGLLPSDIAVTDIFRVADDFHARFSARSRTYRYRIICKPDPLLREQSWYVHNDLDMDRIRTCWDLLPGEHDFSGFCLHDPLLPNYRCTVYNARVEPEENGFTLWITANRFLRSMVRMLVGAAAKVAGGKQNVDWFNKTLMQPESDRTGFTAPASGLVLIEVSY